MATTDPKAAIVRRRWSRRIRPVVGGLLVLAIVLFGPYVLMKIEPIRTLILQSPIVKDALGDRMRLRIENVNRLDLSGLTFGGVELQAQDRVGSWHVVAQADELAASWSLLHLATGRVHVYTLDAAPLIVSLDGIAALRQGIPSPRRASTPRFPVISIRRVRIAPFAVVDSGGVMIQGGLLRSEVQGRREELSLVLREAWVDLVRYGLDVRLTDGRIEWQGNGGHLRGLTLEGEAAAGVVEARYVPGDPDQRLQIDVGLSHLDPRLVARHLLPGLELVEGDSLSGAVQLRQGVGRVTLDFLLAGRLMGEAVDDCAAVLSFGEGLVRLDDVHVSSEAGTVKGLGRWHRRQRRLTVDLRYDGLNHQSRWLPWLHALPLGPPLSGRAKGVLTLPTSGPIQIEGEALVERSRPWGVGIDSLRFAGEVVPGDHVRADQVTVYAPQGTASARGTWPLGPGRLSAEARLDSVPLSVLPAAWRLDIDGRVSGVVAGSGPPLDPVLEGSLQASGLTRGSWHLEQLRADSLIVRPRDLFGSGLLEGRGLRQGEDAPADVRARFVRASAPIELDAEVRRGDLEVRARGELDPAGALRLDAGEVLLPPAGTWRLGRPASFTWDQKTLDLSDLEILSEGTRLRADGRWVPPEKWIEGTIDVRGLDVARLSELLGPDVQLEGRCGLHLEARGRAPDPSVGIRFQGEGLGWSGRSIGDVSLEAHWNAEALRVGPVDIRNGSQEVRVDSLRSDIDRPLFALLGLEGEAVDLARAIRPRPWAGRLAIDRLQLEAWAPVLGLSPPPAEGSDRAVEVTRMVAGRPVPIRIVAPWELGPAGVGSAGLEGSFAGTLEIGGTPGAPEARLVGGVADLRLARIPLGSLDVHLAYANSLLSVQRVQLVDGERVTQAEGFYPIEWSVLPLRAERTDWPARIEADLSGFNLALVSAFTRHVPDAQGRLSGALLVEGTGRDPEVSGSLELRDGGFRIPGRSERIYEAQGTLTLGPGGLKVRSVTARTGPHGVLDLTGTVQGVDRFDLRARAEDVRVFEQGTYDLEATAESLRAFTAIPPGEAEPAPHLQGRIVVQAGTLTPVFGGGSGGGTKTKSPWRIDLDVMVPGEVRVRQSNARVEVGEGSVHVAYRWPYWNASGDLGILGGTYRLFNNNFSILEGNVDFRDTGTGPDVTVEILGETYVATADTTSEGLPEQVRIEVLVQGPPDELQITLTSDSDPPYSPEEIAELLAYGRLVGTRALTEETRDVLFNELVHRIEKAVSDQFPITTSVALETGSSGEVWPPRRVSFQQMITPEITGNYTRQVYHGADWELSLHYRLSRLLYLRAGIVYENEAPRGLNEEYNLDLKCRFEYE